MLDELLRDLGVLSPNPGDRSPRTKCGIFDWLGRRVRMCYWKQWRYARTKVRELMKLGTYRKAAIFVAISRSEMPWKAAIPSALISFLF